MGREITTVRSQKFFTFCVFTNQTKRYKLAKRQRMNALAHFLPKANNRYDPIALKRMKKQGQTIVFKVVYYGRCHARKEPNTRSHILDEYNTGDFVEVFDYAEQGSTKWLKILGHGRNELNKRRAEEAWMLAVDPFCGLDLITRASFKEAREARRSWGQIREYEFDDPKRPTVPGANAAGPSPSPLSELPSSPKSEGTSPKPPLHPSAENHPAHIDPSVFRQATDVDERVRNYVAQEETLRKLRIGKIKTSKPVKQQLNEMPRDGSRDQWARGTKVAVWSNEKCWLPGVVVSIQEEGGLFEKLEVHYKKEGQRHKKIIPRYHRSIRERSPTRSFAPNPSKHVKTGWREHFDTKTSRYYYSNKAEGRVVWDKSALNEGIISEIPTQSPTSTSKSG